MLWTDELDVVAGNNYFDKIAAEIQKWALYLQHLFIKKHSLKCKVTMNNYPISRCWIFLIGSSSTKGYCLSMDILS
jgi:deoxyadenosine/deoxycytidine kinase